MKQKMNNFYYLKQKIEWTDKKTKTEFIFNSLFKFPDIKTLEYHLVRHLCEKHNIKKTDRDRINQILPYIVIYHFYYGKKRKLYFG